MAQIIYYSCEDNKLGFDLEPLKDHVSNILNTPSMRLTGLAACPAFKNVIKNTFVVKSIYSYIIKYDGESITSPMYDQRFFEKVLEIRSIQDGFLSYMSPQPVFISESDRLKLTLGPAYLHDNDITQKTFTISGEYDIGRHLLRKLELSLKFKTPCEIKINEGDALYYVKFHTDEDIIFKKFIFTEELRRITGAYLSTRKFTQGFKSLDWWYSLVSRHNLKKYFLKEIKKNLL